MATPMREDGSVDYGVLADYVEFHIENDTDALVPAGTTGESATLNHAEHCEVIRFVVEQVKGRVPVIAGTGSNATHETIELTRCAKDAGADACLLVTPYYNKPTQEGLVQHYEAVAKAVSIPQILYNVPGRTACDMLASTAIRLSGVDHIIGIKEATGDVRRCQEILAGCQGQEFCISGDDGHAPWNSCLRWKSVSSVTLENVAPAVSCHVHGLPGGDRGQAQQGNMRLESLNRDCL